MVRGPFSLSLARNAPTERWLDGRVSEEDKKKIKKNAHLAPANDQRQTRQLAPRVGQQLCHEGKLAFRGRRPMRSGRRFGVYKHGGRHLAEQQCCSNKDN